MLGRLGVTALLIAGFVAFLFGCVGMGSPDDGASVERSVDERFTIVDETPEGDDVDDRPRVRADGSYRSERVSLVASAVPPRFAAQVSPLIRCRVSEWVDANLDEVDPLDAACVKVALLDVGVRSDDLVWMIRAYQEDQGLVVDGVAGPQTLGSLGVWDG